MAILIINRRDAHNEDTKMSEQIKPKTISYDDAVEMMQSLFDACKYQVSKNRPLENLDLDILIRYEIEKINERENNYGPVNFETTNEYGNWQVKKYMKWWAVFRNDTDIGHENTLKRAIYICENWAKI